MTRPMCPACNQRPRAIAYHKYDRVYYRSGCTRCLNKAKKKKAPTPLWQSAGYKKKSICDRCGFRGRYAAQLLVYHIDGDMRNCQVRNLRTVCQNCAIEVSRLDLPWRAGDLEADR
jgi:hypothetical protein